MAPRNKSGTSDPYVTIQLLDSKGSRSSILFLFIFIHFYLFYLLIYFYLFLFIFIYFYLFLFIFIYFYSIFIYFYNKKEMGLEKTKFIKDTLNPKWNEDFVLNKVMPDYTGVLLQVWDHEEVLSKDNFLVSIFFLNIIKKKIIFFFVNGK